MVETARVNRRRVLMGGGALGALGATGLLRAPAFAAPATTPRLPARGNVVIRGAYVMTMEPATGDIRDGDVHVRDGWVTLKGAVECLSSSFGMIPRMAVVLST